MVTRHFLCGRSIIIFETAPCLRVFIKARADRNGPHCKSLPYSPLPANQRESQVRLMPSLRPIGLTFCPIFLSSGPCCSGADFAQKQSSNAKTASECGQIDHRAMRAETLHHQASADISLGDDKVIDIKGCGCFQHWLIALSNVFLTSKSYSLTRGTRDQPKALSTFLPRISCARRFRFLRADPQHPSQRLWLRCL